MPFLSLASFSLALKQVGVKAQPTLVHNGSSDASVLGCYTNGSRLSGWKFSKGERDALKIKLNVISSPDLRVANLQLIEKRGGGGGVRGSPEPIISLPGALTILPGA